MILIGLFLLVGIYHFMFYAAHREDRANFLGGFFAFGMGLYYLFRTYWIYNLVSNTAVVVKLEFFFIFLMLPALMAYTEMLCNLKTSRVTKIYGAFCALLAVSQLIFSRPYGSDTLIVWQITGIPAMVWIFVNNIVMPFFRELKKGNPFKTALIDTYPGNFLIAVGVFAVTVIIDIIDSLVLHYSIGFTRYSMLAFVLSVAFMLARLNAKTKRELAEKSALLEKANNPAAAREKIFSSSALSEREIVDGFDDIFREHGLSEREIAVASLLAKEGLSARGIAERLYISANTINKHIANIFRKFGVNTRAEFMALFVRKQ
jgi:DNA-binding CsgD family transcriptional regulator